MKKQDKIKFDWSALGAEAGSFERWRDFVPLVSVVRVGDHDGNIHEDMGESEVSMRKALDPRCCEESCDGCCSGDKAPTNLREQFHEKMRELEVLVGTLFDSSVRLSHREHRGKMCRTCHRPTANDLATQELLGEGDGPDLCWGNCDADHD